MPEKIVLGAEFWEGEGNGVGGEEGGGEDESEDGEDELCLRACEFEERGIEKHARIGCRRSLRGACW